MNLHSTYRWHILYMFSVPHKVRPQKITILQISFGATLLSWRNSFCILFSRVLVLVHISTLKMSTKEFCWTIPIWSILRYKPFNRSLRRLKLNLPLRSTLTPLTKRKLILLNVSTTNIQAKVTFEPFSTYEIYKPLNSKINLNQNEGHGDVIFWF